MLKRIAIIAVGLMSFNAVAQDETAKKWSGESELGFMQRSGNTETETLTAKQSLIYDAKPWRNTLTLEATNSSSNDVRTGEKYRITEQLDRFFSERSYGFLRATWETDRFSGFESQSTALLGYGRTLIDNAKVNLKGEIGVGSSSNDVESCDLAPAACGADIDYGETTTSTLYYLSEAFSWKISDPAELGQSLSIEETDDNTISRFEIFLKSQIMSNLAMKLSYGIKYTDVVPEPLDNKDEEIAASLSYSF